MAGGMLEFREIVRIYERERKTRSQTTAIRSSIKATRGVNTQSVSRIW